MRSGAAAHHEGYFHETAFYGSDEELLAVVVPFLRGGQEAGEPTLVTLNAANSALVRRHLDDLEGIDFVDGGVQYRNPAQTIVDYRRRFGALASAGAEQIRVVGDVPHPGTGGCWQTWSRYEFAANDAYAEFPLWGLCPYDTRLAGDEVLEDVRCAHPHVAAPDGSHARNGCFSLDPAVIRERPATAARADGPPAVELVDPDTLAARHALAAVAEGRLDRAAHDDLALAVTEVLTNAAVHGSAPVTLRLWGEPGRVVATVHDPGPGIGDPLLGLMPLEVSGHANGAGLGLWIAHQVCTDVALDWADGFTVRMERRAGA